MQQQVHFISALPRFIKAGNEVSRRIYSIRINLTVQLHLTFFLLFCHSPLVFSANIIPFFYPRNYLYAP